MDRRKDGRPKKVRRAEATVLIVGEGDTEVALLNYLKSLYNMRNCGVSVTIRNAHGHGPENVIDVAVRCREDYTWRAVLLDTDEEWTDKARSRAKRNRIEMLPSDPCVEGLLLTILDQPVPRESARCKRALKSMSLNNRDAYPKCFPKELLDRRCEQVRTLRRLIELLSCPG